MSKIQFKVGDIVGKKNTKHVGFITKVYNSPVKVTYEVTWFEQHNKPQQGFAIEGYFLEKV